MEESASVDGEGEATDRGRKRESAANRTDEEGGGGRWSGRAARAGAGAGGPAPATRRVVTAPRAGPLGWRCSGGGSERIDFERRGDGEAMENLRVHAEERERLTTHDQVSCWFCSWFHPQESRASVRVDTNEPLSKKFYVTKILL